MFLHKEKKTLISHPAKHSILIIKNSKEKKLPHAKLNHLSAKTSHLQGTVHMVTGANLLMELKN